MGLDRAQRTLSLYATKMGCPYRAGMHQRWSMAEGIVVRARPQVINIFELYSRQRQAQARLAVRESWISECQARAQTLTDTSRLHSPAMIHCRNACPG